MEKSARERVVSKLSESLKNDIKDSEVKTNIENVRMTDGKITARFCISGLPQKGESHSNSYRDIDKIFDNWASFGTEAEAFLTAPDSELKKLAKS